MKKILTGIVLILLSGFSIAQAQLAFPFQGGKTAMDQFFKDSLYVSQDIAEKRITGTAILKFSATQNGTISKIVVYYADDALLVQPTVDALKRSNHKWIIPDKERMHDFIIPFIFSFALPAVESAKLRKVLYDDYHNRKPILAKDQVPLDMTTLLPPVPINYDLPSQ